jgi:Flp pilus assembly protein TadG
MLRSFARRLTGSSRAYVTSEKGSAAVEFAMVSFPFFYVLGAVLEIGLMLFTEYALQASVQEASRLIRTGQAQKAGMSGDAFKSKVCETAGIIIDCMGKTSINVNSLASFSALDSASPDLTDVGPDAGGAPTNSFNAGAASTSTSIIVTYDWDFVLPFMEVFGNIEGGKKRRLIGFSVFRNEPFS